MVNPRQVVRALVFALLLSLLFAASVSTAYGQFTLTVSSGLSPSAIDPGSPGCDPQPRRNSNSPVS